MKKITLLSLLIMGVAFGSFAQDKKSKKKDKKDGEVRVVVVNSENGVVTQTEETYSLKDKKKMEKMLKEKGIELSFDGESGVHVTVEGEGDLDKKVIVRTMNVDGSEIVTEDHVKVITLKDGETIADDNVEVIIKEMKDGEGNKFVFKTVNEFVIDEDGEFEVEVEKLLEGKMMVFVRKESKENVKTGLPKSINEVFDGEASIKDLNLFPNPTNGNFKMKFTSEKAEDFDLSITDSKGSVIYEKSLTKFKGEFSEDFDLSKYDAGVYFFNLSSKEQTLSKQIVVQ